MIDLTKTVAVSEILRVLQGSWDEINETEKNGILSENDARLERRGVIRTAHHFGDELADYFIREYPGA